MHKFPVRLEHIPPERFSFGSALNFGGQVARGRIIVNLSAHCTPTTHDWLRQLVEPLRRDHALVATYGRQEPRKGINPFEEPGLQFLFPTDRVERPGALFSNANCAIWRTALLDHPFDEKLTFSEDLVWRMQFDPGQIRYISEASVYHSHSLNLRYWARRFENSGAATSEMRRRYGIINPYFLSSAKFSEVARGFLSGCIQWSISFGFQGYFRFIPFVPLFEGVRAWSTMRGLRRGKGTGAREIQPVSESHD